MWYISHTELTMSNPIPKPPTVVLLRSQRLKMFFLFSGSALSQKPVNSDGTYNGNAESLTAMVGSGVELPYNNPNC